jgi:UPF0716 protein FxsA
MAALLFVLLLVIPIAELWVIIQVADRIGALNTVAILVLVSIAGAWLLKQQGMSTWRRLQDTLRRGRVPAQEVADGALILFGGALLLTPGFLTDVIGLLLLIPPTRAAIRNVFRRGAGRWARRRVDAHGRDVPVTRRTVPARTSLDEPRTRDEDDSPDTR